VLAGLERGGIPIDRIGGCSMGALIGALYASGYSPGEIKAICRDEMVSRRPFRDWTLPRAGLVRGRRLGAMLARLFGSRRIEELPLDFFCVSADLVAAELVVHRDGLVADAVAASMSIPGVLPPRRSGARLLVDGGVLDNLPIQTMVAAGEGPVVASDVMGRRLAESNGAGAGTVPRPNVVETIARAAVLGSWQALSANAALAETIIRPELDGIGLLAFDRLDEMVAAGERAVARGVPAIRGVGGNAKSGAARRGPA
jgi:predicted acylesterase/phospholipase RssA